MQKPVTDALIAVTEVFPAATDTLLQATDAFQLQQMLSGE